MKRGWKWLTVLVICLAVCLAAGLACASGLETGPVITDVIPMFGGVGDGYWMNEPVQVWIDATDAVEVYLKDTADGEYMPLHEDYRWNMPEDEFYDMDASYWGDRHETINIWRELTQTGSFTFTVKAGWEVPVGYNTGAVGNGLAWKETTFTITVQSKGTLPEPGVTLTGLDSEGRIRRGDVLLAAVTKSPDATNCSLCVYAEDENGDTTDERLVDIGYVDYAGANTDPVRIPTMGLPAGKYELEVTQNCFHWVSGSTCCSFTVTEDGWVEPAEPVWQLSKTEVDTYEPFSVSVYIPGVTGYTELYVEQEDGGSGYGWGNNGVATIPFIRLGNTNPVSITAYTDDWEYCYEGPFSVEGDIDAPVPVITGLDKIVPAGEDISFTIGVAEGEECPEGIVFEVRLYQKEYMVAQRTGPGPVTIPWGALEEYQETQPGSTHCVYVRACGEGYVSSGDTRQTFYLGGPEDENFRISFAGTDETQMSIPVGEGYTLMVELPADTSGIELIEIHNCADNDLTFSPDSLPAEGIETGCYRYTYSGLPVYALYKKTDGTCRYSNMLFVEVTAAGSLPAPQFTVGVAADENGEYHIRQGSILRVTLTNPEDYAEFGDSAFIYARLLDEVGDVWGDWQSNGFVPGQGTNDFFIPTWNVAAGEEPYTICVYADSDDDLWDDSENTETELYVDADGTEGVRLITSATEVETNENFVMQVYAPGAVRTELRMVENEDNSSVQVEADADHTDLLYWSEQEPFTLTFFGRAYYEEDGDPVDSDPVVIRVTAPHGPLADALTVVIPDTVAPGEDLVIQAVSLDGENEIIPDSMSVGYENLYTSRYHTGVIVIPAEDEDLGTLLEEGRIYTLSVSVYKQGYETLRYQKRVIVIDPAVTESALMRVNGSDETADLMNRTEYTVTLSSLPLGVTMTAIMEADGKSWQYFTESGEETSVTHTFIPCAEMGERAIYALYTTEEIEEGQHGSTVQWTGRTNAVPIRVGCNHTGGTYEEITWGDVESCVPDGKQQHLVTGQAYVNTVCSDCGMCLETGEEYKTGLADHVFCDGVCEDCGYECEHEAEDLTHYAGMKGEKDEDWFCECVDDEWHHTEGYYVEYDECENCGEIMNYFSREIDEYERHHYDENLYCDLCGHTAAGSVLTVSRIEGCGQYVTIVPDTDVALGVTAESNLSGELTYQWYEVVRDEETGDETDVPLVIGGEPADGAVITLEGVTRSMTLYVEVSDGYSSERVAFTIEVDNELVAQAEGGETEIIVASGGTATLKVTASCAKGSLSYRWYVEAYDPAAGADMQQELPDETDSALVLTGITKTGHYFCEVSDEYGATACEYFNVYVCSNNEEYAFSLLKGDRIGVPDMVVGSTAYPVVSLVSDNPSVVKVNGDTLEAKSAGRAAVTAKYLYGAAIREFTITVRENSAENVAELPAHLETIGEGAFAWDSGMWYVIVPAGVQTIESNAFAHTGDVTVRFMSGDTVPEDGAFSESDGVALIEENSALEAYFRENGRMYFYVK